MTTSEQPPPMATPRTAAGVIFRNERGQVLLVKPTYKDGWEVPGGYVEPGESPLAAARREVHEELGLSVDVDNLLVVDWAPSPTEGDKLLFLFDGGTLPREVLSSVKLPADEISAADFHDESQLPLLLPARLARRVIQAMHGGGSYLEHGAPPASVTAVGL